MVLATKLASQSVVSIRYVAVSLFRDDAAKVRNIVQKPVDVPETMVPSNFRDALTLSVADGDHVVHSPPAAGQ